MAVVSVSARHSEAWLNVWTVVMWASWDAAIRWGGGIHGAEVDGARTWFGSQQTTWQWSGSVFVNNCWRRR